MATNAAKLQAVIEANTKDFDKAMDRANKSVEELGDKGSKHIKKFEKNAGESLARVSKGLGMLGAGLSVGVSLPLIGLGKAAFQSAVKMESLEAMLRTVMGSAGATAKELKALEKSAKLPGLDFSQAVKGSANLQSMGFTADRARFLLENFANAIAKAGGGREEFERVVVNLTQIGSSAKLTGDELREMAQAVGPEFRQAMQKAFDTVDPQKLAKMGISGKQAIEMIAVELSKTARANADTMRNQLDNFEQEMEMFKAKIGKTLLPIAKDILPQVSEAVQDVAKWFGNLNPETQQLAVKMGILAVAIGPATGVLSAVTGLLSLGGRFISWYRNLSVATDGLTAAQLRYNVALQTSLGLLGKIAGLAGIALSLGGTQDYKDANARRYEDYLKTPEGRKRVDIYKRSGVAGLTSMFESQGNSRAAAQFMAKEIAAAIKAYLDKQRVGMPVGFGAAQFGLQQGAALYGSIGSGGGSSRGGGGFKPVDVSGAIGQLGLPTGAPSGAVGHNIGEMLAKGLNLGQLAKYVDPATEALAKYTEGLRHLATEAAKLQDPRTRVAEYFQMELADFKKLDEAVQKSAITRFTKDNVVPAIKGAFAAIGQAFADLKTEQDAWAKAGLDAFEKWYYALKKTRDEAIEAGAAIGGAIGEDLGQAVDDIAGGLTDMQMLWQDVAASFVDAFTFAIRDLDKGFGSFFDNVVRGFEEMLLDISAQIIRAQLTQLIFSALNLGAVPGRASGGPVSGGRPYVVGENGPELFVPQGSGKIVPNDRMGGGVNITMNISTPDPGAFRRSQNQIIRDALTEAQMVGSRG
jgi:tape measure domain-containing protein